MKDGSKRVLLISYNFPPLREAQSVRWAFLSKWLCREGWHVDVVTVELPQYYRFLNDYIGSDVNVHRTYPGPLQGIFFRLKARVGVEDRDFKDRRSRPSIRVARFAYRAARSLANKLLVPDIRTEWLPFGLGSAHDLLKRGDYDLMISSHEPGVSHLVAWLLKMRHGVRWVADYGDPWITGATPKWRKSVDRFAEFLFIGRIDGFIFTNDATICTYRARYPNMKGKPAIKISQGFDPDVVSSAPPYRFASDSMNIVYTGTFYKGLREPYETFRAVREARNSGMEIVLHLAGNVFDEYTQYIRDNGMSEYIVYHGYLVYESSISIQKSADVLLYIGNANDYQTPGKIFEYLGVERPILVVWSHSSDSTARLITSLGRGTAVSNQQSEVYRALASIYDDWKKGLLEKRFDLGQVDAYSFHSHARAIIKEFQNIAHASPSPQVVDR